MPNSVLLDETIDVERPVHEVFTYLAEFCNVEQWDPGVTRATRLTPGPPRVGSAYRITLKAGLALNYRIVELVDNTRLRMEVSSRWLRARDHIHLESTGTGTRVRYIAEFDLSAPLAVLHRINPNGMQRIGKEAMAGLKAALDDRFSPPQPSAWTAAADSLILPGLAGFTRFGFEAHRARWKPMSSYVGDRHMVITGATSGIGRAAAERLAAMGAQLTLVARDRAKADALIQDIAAHTGNPQLRVEIADLSHMGDVHALANRLLWSDRAIDVLINNAGALFNQREETKEGFERSYALLLLGPYILTEALKPLLAQGQTGRVINVLSGGMYTQKIDVDDLQNQRAPYNGTVAYARAKRGLMILTEEWAKHWRTDGIVVNAMHPGWTETPGLQASLPTFYTVTRPLLRTPEQGADTVVWLAAATEANHISGQFWLDRAPHPTHLVPFTRESPGERRRLLEMLAAHREGVGLGAHPAAHAHQSAG